MMNKIFGIGWAKTGTTTLGKCFQILGFNHQGQKLDLVPDLKKNDLSTIRHIAPKKDTFEDWPWILLFKELDDMFPGSKFVLTVRDEELWLRSYRNMLNNEKKPSEKLNEIRHILYNLPFPNVTDTQLIERYISHNREVTEYFSNRSDSLLVVNWEEGDGWEELCDFLRMDIPSEPFPHANKGNYSRNNIFNNLFHKLLP